MLTKLVIEKPFRYICVPRDVFDENFQYLKQLSIFHFPASMRNHRHWRYQRFMHGVKVLDFQIHNAILVFVRTHEIKNKIQFHTEKLNH